MSKKGEEKERLRRMKAIERAAKKKSRGGARGGEKVGLLKRGTNFLKDVRRELKKVSWPSKDETISSTWVVLTVVLIFGFYFYVVDMIVSTLIRKMLTFGL